MTRNQLREWAIRGAVEKLSVLRDQISQIEGMFPELAPVTGDEAKRTPKTARRLSPAARAKIGARMKRYWATRRHKEADGGQKRRQPRGFLGTDGKQGEGAHAKKGA